MGFFKGLSSIAETAGLGKVSRAFAEDAISAARMSTTTCNNIMANEGTRLLRQALRHSGDLDDSVVDGINKVLKDGDLDKIKSYIDSNVNGSSAFEAISGKDEAFKTALETYNKHKGIVDAHGKDTMGAARELLGRKENQEGLGVINTLSAFYGDKDYGATRIGTTIAGISGVGIATRLLSGGSLVKTASGERDIAGVPFF